MNKRPRKQPFQMKFLQKTPPKQSCFGAGNQPYKNHELNIISENSTAKKAFFQQRNIRRKHKASGFRKRYCFFCQPLANLFFSLPNAASNSSRFPQ
jgi:hypothetical protein